MANNFTLHFLKKLETFAFRDRLFLTISKVLKGALQNKKGDAQQVDLQWQSQHVSEKGTSTKLLVQLMGQIEIH